jgi:hypothetical protein
MIYLATEIAKKNNLSLYTFNSDAWTASTYFVNEGTVQEAFFPGDEYYHKSNAALAPVFIGNIFPENLLDLSPKEILKFRAKRADERKQFHDAFDDFCNKLYQAYDPKILRQIWNEERRKVEYALTEYKKSMDILRPANWGGSVAAIINIATDALGYRLSLAVLRVIPRMTLSHQVKIDRPALVLDKSNHPAVAIRVHLPHRHRLALERP